MLPCYGETTLKNFGRINLLVNDVGLYERLSSDF